MRARGEGHSFVTLHKDVVSRVQLSQRDSHDPMAGRCMGRHAVHDMNNTTPQNHQGPPTHGPQVQRCAGESSMKARPTR